MQLPLFSTVLWATFALAQRDRFSTSVSLHPNDGTGLEEPSYYLWKVDQGAYNSTFEVDGLKFTLLAEGSDASGPKGTFLGGVTDEVYNRPFPSIGQRVVGSAITTEAKAGGLKLLIEGLPQGSYQFLTWVNGFDDARQAASVMIDVNGSPVTYLRHPTEGADSYYEASASQFTITPKNGVAEVVWAAYPRVRDGNVYIAGFEINGVSPWNAIAYPKPGQYEENVEIEAGELTITWDRSPDWEYIDVQVYNIYFGEEQDALDLVSRDQKERDFTISGLRSGKTYYWRADSKVGTFGTYELGRVYQFTTA